MSDNCNPILSMDLDLQCFGVFSSDMSLESPLSSDGSSGYLQDAIADYGSILNNGLRSHDQMMQQDLDGHEFANPFMKGTSMATQCVAEDSSTKVLYPFSVVKSGGLEGDLTLRDVNRRLLMRPSKPIPHLVVDFETDRCVSSGGLGLSGKVVVSLTKIHTQGRGSITIVRTKG